ISDMIRFGRAGGRCECLGECGLSHELAELAIEDDGELASHPIDDRCLARHAEPHPRTGSNVILTTAHLDHAPENSDNPDGVFVELPLERSNLRAYCQGCHLYYDRDHHAERARQTREEQREQIGLW
ncbi:hypothetical protein LCGC14_3044190, partial [marine sediment metagenome]